MQAGILYLYLGIAGGLALLFAIMMLYSATGTVDITPVLDQLVANRTLIYVLFLIGFGIKAGLSTAAYLAAPGSSGGAFTGQRPAFRDYD
jgi:formate hydrogenlyase subunit 3/multisubunit Na+/H+ antiporter MnhD subunit